MRAARTAAPRVVLAGVVLVVLHAENVFLGGQRVVIIAHRQLRRFGIPKTKTLAAV